MDKETKAELIDGLKSFAFYFGLFIIFGALILLMIYLY
jgi:hypothetical protein